MKNEINGMSVLISVDECLYCAPPQCCLWPVLQVSEAVAIVRNSFNSEQQTTPAEDRSVDDEVLNEVEHFVQGHDLLVKLPGATLNLSPRNLDHNEVTMTLNFNHKQGRAATLDEGNSLLTLLSDGFQFRSLCPVEMLFVLRNI